MNDMIKIWAYSNNVDRHYFHFLCIQLHVPTLSFSRLDLGLTFFVKPHPLTKADFNHLYGGIGLTIVNGSFVFIREVNLLTDQAEY
jgi:hypothetical protein